MALVRGVLGAADRHGYLLGDPAGHTSASCWRASTLTDPGTGTSTLVATEPGEAAMVAQLLGRGWLARATRRRTRVAVRGDRSSGRRRGEVAVDAVTTTAAARAALLRWSSLAAVPVQRPGPIDHPYPHPSNGGPHDRQLSQEFRLAHR